MNTNVNFTTSYNSSLTSGNQSLQNAKAQSDLSRFSDLVKSAQAAAEEEKKVNLSSVSSSQVKDGSRLNGDYTQGFSGLYKTEADKHSSPIGAAANGANPHAPKTEIDRTSKLYEQALQLENYFVKIMLSSMRSTVQKAGGEQSYAQSMYEDMMYDQYSETLTKNAGFGLADQIYVQLAGK